MRIILLVLFISSGHLTSVKCNAQIPTTQTGIDQFIDSLGHSTDRQSITSSMYPAMANGSNYLWKLHMVYNKNNLLLWVEDKIPDSVSTVFIFCEEKLIFVSQFTYTYFLDSISKERKPVFRKVYFVNDEVISDSSPSQETYTSKYFLEQSKAHLELFKKKDR